MFKKSQRKILLSLDETLSISKTAELLGISQPAVSLAIKEIENIARKPIIFHRRRPLVFTPMGKLLVHQFKRIDTLELETAKAVSDLDRGMHQLLRIGTVTSFSSNINPYYVSELLKLSHKIITKQAHSFEIEELIEKGELDFAVVNREIENENILSRKLFEEYYVPAVPSDIIRNGCLEFSEYIHDLEEIPFIFSGSKTIDNQIVHRLLRMMFFNSAKVMEVDCYSSICQLISERNCWAFMPPFGLWVGRDYISNLTILKSKEKFSRTFYLCSHNHFSKEEERQILKLIHKALTVNFLPRLKAFREELADLIKIDPEFEKQCR